jgi:methylmalonyl-CoA mutase
LSGKTIVLMNKDISFGEFSPLHREDWIEKIKKETGVEDIAELEVQLAQDFTFSPLATAGDANAAPVYRGNADWTIVHCQEKVRDEVPANKNMLKALEGGANGLYVEVPGTVKWAKLLLDIELTYIRLFVQTSEEKACTELEAYLEKNYPSSAPEVFILCPVFTVRASLPNLRYDGVDGRPYAESVFPPQWTLGLMLAEVYEHICNGKSPGSIWMLCGTTGHYFLDICQLRALRQLWIFLMDQLEMNDKPAFIYAQTSLHNKSVEDIYNNMLRNTTEGMASVLGGADALCLLPHNINEISNDRFGQRISRNTQLLFQYEAHLNKTADPVAGSYFFEKVTRDLAEKSWEVFKEIEAGGGFRVFANKGSIVKMHNTYRAAEQEAVNSGAKKRIGVNVYKADNG